MGSVLVRSVMKRWGKAGRRAAAFALVMTLANCRAPEERAARYAARYEAALAANDPWSARVAIRQAVRYQDSNAEYWAALGRVQLTLGDYPGAYAAYTRANELDRSDAQVLQTLADLSVMSGNVDDSRRFARQVLLLQPSNLGPQTTLGFAALHDRDYDDALKRADTVLAAQPQDTNATILKARALASDGEPRQALSTLQAFVAAHPGDQAALDALAEIAGRFGDLPGQKIALARQVALRPNDPALKIDYARTLYQLGERAPAHAITVRMAETAQHGGRLIDILALWLRYEPRATALADARSLAARASAADRVRYAYFLMLAGVPAEAEALLAPLAAPPVTAANAAPLALLAQARGLQGRTAEALKLLDAVLRFDPGNVMALRARIDLYLRTGRGGDAVPDAQRLVASKPRAADDRVRLARAYQLSGQPQLAENTFRGGIQDMPADPLIFAALRRFLRETGRNTDIAELDQQYIQQKRLVRERW